MKYLLKRRISACSDANNVSDETSDDGSRRKITATAPTTSCFPLSLWNALIFASAVAEIVGYTILPPIVKRSYGCYPISEQQSSIGSRLRRMVTGGMQRSTQTTNTTTDIWNCTIPAAASTLSASTTTTAKALEKLNIQYQNNNCHLKMRESCNTLDINSCCNIIHMYRVRSSALFSSFGFIHAFIFAIQFAQSRKYKLDKARWHTISNWQQSEDNILLSVKKWIVNYFHHLLDDVSPSSSSSAASFLELLDFLDVIVITLLVVMFQLSLLPHNFWSHVNDAVKTLRLPAVLPAYPSHPNLEVKLRLHASFLIWYIREMNARNTKQLKRQMVKFAILHPLDFYYYLRLVNNSYTLIKYLLSATDAFLNQLDARSSLRKAKEDYKKAKMAIDVLNLIIERKEVRLTKAIIALQRNFRCKHLKNDDKKIKPSTSVAMQHQESDISACCTKPYALKLSSENLGDNSSSCSPLENQLQQMKQNIQVLNTNPPRSLLLRPTTKNAILWRRLNLACSTLELLQNALYPILLRSTGATSLEDCLHILVMWRTCYRNLPDKKSSSKAKKTNMMNLFRTPRFEEHKCPDLNFWQRFRTSIYIWFIYRFLWVAGIVKFINCFVSFFEGSYDEDGILVPKPFFGKPFYVFIVVRCSLFPDEC